MATAATDRPGFSPVRRPMHPAARRGFSLVELVIVLIIVGLLASMAVPRISRGSESAGDAALDADMAVLRSAIFRYAAEHGSRYPGPAAKDVLRQLTQYTSAGGAPSQTRSATHLFGPYLVRIPPVPVGPNRGNSGIVIDSVNSPPKIKALSTAGWVYNPNTGEIIPNDERTAAIVTTSTATVGG